MIAGFVFCLFSSVSAYSGGSGEPNNPYQIASKVDLMALAGTPTDYNKCFILTADIDMQGQIFTTAIIAADTNSEVFFQGTAFTGTFDGNSHKITHFTINDGSNWYLGLFGQINFGGLVKNLGIESFSVSGPSDSWYVGGLVGWNYGSISNCYAMGAVSGTLYVGGLVGVNSNSISKCYSACAVSGSDYVGGLVGINAYGSSTITVCYSTGAVSGNYCVGGLVGLNFLGGSISNCYSTGIVSGGSNSRSVGGSVGYNEGGNISNCYSTGIVSGGSNSWNVGGFVGKNDGSLSTSFWDVNTSGWSTSAGGEGKTTAEMKTLSTFTSAGWDFSYTDGDGADWFIQIDEYPILVWQISPADIYTDGRNNFRDFAVFAQYWMREDCAIYNYYCDWADLDFNGSVDIDDLIILMSYWLQSGIYN